MNAKLQKLLSYPKRLLLTGSLRPLLRRAGLIKDAQQAGRPDPNEGKAPPALNSPQSRRPDQAVDRAVEPRVERAREQQRRREVKKQREQRKKNAPARFRQPRVQERQSVRAAARDTRPAAALNPTARLNTGTQPGAGSRAPFDCTAKSIAIILDNPNALAVVNDVAGKARKVQVLCTSDALADRDEIFRLQDSPRLAVSSVHRYYGTPLSGTEVEAVGLAKACSADIFDVLKRITGRHISDGVISVLATGVEQGLYLDALTFHTARSCLEEFDLVLLAIDDARANGNVIKSFLYHGRVAHASDRIFRSSPGGGIARLDETALRAPKPRPRGTIDESRLIADFTALWQGLQDPVFDDHPGRGSYVAACGHVAPDNYGHAPASLKLVEVLARQGRYPVLFHSSVLMSVEDQHVARTALLARNLSGRCTVYEGCRRRYEKKYPPAILGKASIFSEGIFELILDVAGKRLPHQLMDALQPKLSRYVQNLFTQTVFISESTRSMDRCKLVATAVDRSLLSRILCALAKDMGIPSIGIQSQIMSVSSRYLRPAVDRMGVVDSSQMEIYKNLGARPDSLEVIGSVNYVDRLRTLDSHARGMTAPADKRAILFAMQYAHADQMLAISSALIDIADRRDLRLVVKPHPKQELSVLNEVQRIFRRSGNATVLSRESDTYAAIPPCGMVVGLNSNVLLESALIGKPVLVAAFNDLHPSIDYSMLGVALKSLSAAELEEHILDVMAGGPLSRRLAATRDEYLRKNPQFSRPYTYERIESFIASGLREDCPNARSIVKLT